MPHAPFALGLALATLAINLGELAHFSDGNLPRAFAAAALWGTLPGPVTYLLGARTIRGPLPARILCGGLMFALAIAVFAAWDILYSAGALVESLGRLIVVAAPAYQTAVLAGSLLVAWIVEWRLRVSASRA